MINIAQFCQCKYLYIYVWWWWQAAFKAFILYLSVCRLFVLKMMTAASTTTLSSLVIPHFKRNEAIYRVADTANSMESIVVCLIYELLISALFRRFFCFFLLHFPCIYHLIIHILLTGSANIAPKPRTYRSTKYGCVLFHFAPQVIPKCYMDDFDLFFSVLLIWSICLLRVRSSHLSTVLHQRMVHATAYISFELGCFFVVACFFFVSSGW